MRDKLGGVGRDVEHTRGQVGQARLRAARGGGAAATDLEASGVAGA